MLNKKLFLVVARGKNLSWSLHEPGMGLGRFCSKLGYCAMLLCFLLLAIMFWVGYYYALLTYAIMFGI